MTTIEKMVRAFLEVVVFPNNVDPYIEGDLWVEFPTRDLAKILKTYHQKLTESESDEFVIVRKDRLKEVLRGVVHHPCELKAGWWIEDWLTYLTETEQ